MVSVGKKKGGGKGKGKVGGKRKGLLSKGRPANVAKNNGNDDDTDTSSASDMSEMVVARTKPLPKRSGLGYKAFDAEESDEDEEELKSWVRCDSCRKWRRLPDGFDLQSLTDADAAWFCHMNTSDPEHNSCAAPEVPYPKERSLTTHRARASVRSEQRSPPPPPPLLMALAATTAHGGNADSGSAGGSFGSAAAPAEDKGEDQQRRLVLEWARRIKCADRAESRLPGGPIVTRGKAWELQPRPMQWVQCCNPCCGKWRALLRNADVDARRGGVGNGKPWYCVMNYWDESLASCAAPQESEVCDADLFPVEEPKGGKAGIGTRARRRS